MQPSCPSIILSTLNARYIHAALGLRYLLANMARHGGAALRAASVLREFTIKRPPQEIADALLAELGDAPDGIPQIIGFGIYIWNVEASTEVVRLLKRARPTLIIVLGGPEVSHEWEVQEIVGDADYLITGWGDVSFPKLCRTLWHGARPGHKVITGEQPSLALIALPYAEYSAADLAHRLLYVEASRGCPFKCEFCLSALDQTAWAFDLPRILAALAGLHRRGARHFKFVDRTFNLRIDNSLRILEFFLERLTPDLSLHFEVIPDHLPERLKAMIARFPPGVLQLEVGIQTFNPEVQQAISRRQDNPRSAANLDWLIEHSHAHLHVDLIFGLPGETLASFAEGFDRLYAQRPHEIQLGLLKRLRGTPLARRSEEFGMVYDALPPYSVRQTAVLDVPTIQRFTRLARYWDLLANSARFPHTLSLLLSPPSPFAAFSAVADWLWQKTGKTSALTPEILIDALFDYLTQVLGRQADVVRPILLADYLNSGARANPTCLQGLLAQRESPLPGKARALALRQARHGSTSGYGTGSSL
ncbi:MAG: Radical [Proteobacteria bacterium]|nr:Radical [Pseudomonadota bacterium]